MTVNELEKELKEGKLNHIYLFYGEETYLLENSLKKIKKIFGNCIQGINFIQIDETNINSLISELQTPAFGYEKKLIIVRANLFKKSNNKTEEKENKNSNQSIISKYIEEHIEEIKESIILLFVEDAINKNSLYKVIEQNGIICNFERLKPNELALRLKAICNAYKVNVDLNTTNYFIETCGTNMQNLINELRKLIEYAGKGGTITKDSIDNLVVQEFESRIFDLTDNLGKKDILNAMKILKELIYITKLCLEKNRDIIEVLKLKSNQIFLASKYKKQASYFEEEELKNILKELIELDRKSKIGLIDVNIGLEAVLCTYI